jgi:antitoxin component HigA of HigAB toxin-antitoxin module
MTTLDPEKYARLLADARPAVIDSEQEHDRLLSLAESLMERGKQALSPEEIKLLELLVLLVESFERSVEEEDDEEAGDSDEGVAQPHETLQRLLQARGLETTDIVHFFSNPHSAAEALAGNRPISRGQAKQLGKFFRVPARLFLT